MTAPLHSRSSSGYSLLEILCVVALVAILSALAAPAFGSIRRNAAIVAAGNQFADALALARQKASSQNTFTCLVLVTNTQAGGLDEQIFTVMEYERASAAWKQALAWARLPREVTVADVSGGAEASSARQAALGLAPMTMRWSGVSLSPDHCAMVLLHPEGGLVGNTAASRKFSARLSTDFERGPEYTPSNYYDLVVSADSAACRVLRP